MASVVRLLKGKTVSVYVAGFMNIHCALRCVEYYLWPVGGVLKKGWDEIPEVIASSVLALVGLGLGGIGVYNYYAKDGDNRRYKLEYTVIRPDDPRVAKIRKD